MGWCSGTEIFDHVVKVILDTPDPFMERSTKRIVIAALIRSMIEHDWDCEHDSDYWEHPLVRLAFKEALSDWDWEEIENE
jgi:hypothetical protein